MLRHARMAAMTGRVAALGMVAGRRLWAVSGSYGWGRRMVILFKDQNCIFSDDIGSSGPCRSI
jgi:hypothetical protein